jgi:TPR repeat protein
MKTIFKALFLLVSLILTVPVFAQSDFEAAKARAEAGDVQSQYELGVMYRNGEGVAQNDQEAVKWYRLAAEQGNVLSQNLLGLQYLAGGMGVVQNYKDALNWFILAAKQGHSGSQSEIAMMHERGRGVSQNFSIAYIWYSLANTTQIRGSELPLVSGYSIARDRVAAKLSPQALEQAQAQATRCFESNFKDCD